MAPSQISLLIDGKRRSERLLVSLYDESRWWGGGNDKCHPELLKWRQRQKYARHSNRYIEKARNYYLDNAESKREYGRNHYSSNKEAYIARANERKKKIKEDVKSLTDSEREDIKLTYKWRDFLNSNHGSLVFEVDHMNPLSNGGVHHPSNVQFVPKNTTTGKRLRLELIQKNILPQEEESNGRGKRGCETI